MRWVWLAYLNVAIVTFGHAWTTNLDVPAGTRAYAAIASTALWPLYWSVRAWEATR